MQLFLFAFPAKMFELNSASFDSLNKPVCQINSCKISGLFTEQYKQKDFYLFLFICIKSYILH